MGEEHPQVARNLVSLGLLERRRGRYDRAAAYTERALRLRIEHLAPDHPQIGR